MNIQTISIFELLDALIFFFRKRPMFVILSPSLVCDRHLYFVVFYDYFFYLLSKLTIQCPAKKAIFYTSEQVLRLNNLFTVADVHFLSYEKCTYRDIDPWGWCDLPKEVC